MVETLDLQQNSNSSTPSGGACLSAKFVRNLELAILSSDLKPYDPVTNSDSNLENPGIKNACVDAFVQEAQSKGVDLGGLSAKQALKLAPKILTPKSYFVDARLSLRQIAEPDFEQVFRLSFNAFHEDAYRGRVAIRTVFGMSKNMPLRALSYLLPALHLAKTIKYQEEYKPQPEVQFIFMPNTVARLNGHNLEKCREQVALFTDLARTMIHDNYFFSDLENQVVFATDENFNNDNRIRTLAKENIEALQAVADPEGQGAVVELTADERANSLEYAALHPLVHDIALTEGMFLDSESGKPLLAKPEVVINVGGLREKLFYRLRRALRRSLAASGQDIIPSIQIFGVHSVPPYIQMPDEDGRNHDITLDEALKDPKQIPHSFKPPYKSIFERDFDLLDECMSVREFLQSFLGQEIDF